MKVIEINIMSCIERKMRCATFGAAFRALLIGKFNTSDIWA